MIPTPKIHIPACFSPKPLLRPHPSLYLCTASICHLNTTTVLPQLLLNVVCLDPNRSVVSISFPKFLNFVP
ncbi:hypothetical protein Hanom_Chr00s002855g01706201 [Helianthus anomalus]